MAKPVRGCLTPQPPEDASEPEENPSVPQQEELPDTAEGEVLVDYYPDVGSEPENEPVAQDEKEENSNTEYSNMGIPEAGTFHQWMMLCNVLRKIQWVHIE